MNEMYDSMPGEGGADKPRADTPARAAKSYRKPLVQSLGGIEKVTAQNVNGRRDSRPFYRYDGPWE